MQFENKESPLEIRITSRKLSLIIKGFDHQSVVVSESFDLMLVFLLTIAACNVALGPLTVASCDLFGTLPWVLAVVTVEHFTQVTSFTVLVSWSWSTMGKIVGIIVTTLLLVTLESILHAIGSFRELGDEFFLALPEAEMIGQKLGGEFDQAIQALKWMTWWDLFVISCRNGKENCLSEFHLDYKLSL